MADRAQRTADGTEVAAILFTSNLVGILFARSLHYQFQSWYFYQLPLLVHLSRSRLAGALLLVPIAYGWATYPSTEASSLGLVLGNAGLLALVWLGDAEGRRPSSPTSDVDGGVVESRKAR
jgi:alpha-1,3-mannosyltransferase